MGIIENRIKYLITYECNHTRTFQEPSPQIGEFLWCPSCQKNVRVISAPPEWSARCMNCIYSRRFGTGRIDAEISAGKHRIKHPTHFVRLFNGGRHVTTFGECDQTVIPMISESDQTPDSNR